MKRKIIFPSTIILNRAIVIAVRRMQEEISPCLIRTAASSAKSRNCQTYCKFFRQPFLD